MNYLIYVVIAILLVMFIWYVIIKNKFNQTIIKIDEASSGIDIALTKRYDVLTELISVVKNHMKYEKDTLFEIVNLRQGMSIEELNVENSKMNKNMEKINILVENYPNLKTSESFQILQKSIIEVEEHLQASRRMYNSNVSIYNQMLVTIPSCFVASLLGLKEKNFFVADEIKKNNLKIKL